MSRVSLSTVKTKFETGDRPSQQDYEDLIDSTSAQSTDLGSLKSPPLTALIRLVLSRVSPLSVKRIWPLSPRQPGE